MRLYLSVAENTGTSDANLILPLVCLGCIVAIGLMALGPLVVGAKRRHRHGQGLLTTVVVWAAVAIGVAVVTVIQQSDWTAEREKRVNSGYYDPKDNSAAPALPGVMIAVLGVGYVGLIGWAAVGPRRTDVGFLVEPRVE